MPTLSTHVPDEWEYADALKRVVDERFRGKPGPYLRELLERDLSGQADDLSSPEILVRLTRRLLGEIDAATVAEAMRGRDQRKELRWILRTFLAQLSDPEMPLLVAEAQAQFTATLLAGEPPRNLPPEESTGDLARRPKGKPSGGGATHK